MSVKMCQGIYFASAPQGLAKRETLNRSSSENAPDKIVEMKPNFELGAKGFEVEWCYDLPRIEGTNDVDIDEAKYRRIVCPTIERARARAREVYPLDKWGAVRITPVEFQDPFGDRLPVTYRWEPIGDSEEYSGEDAQ